MIASVTKNLITTFQRQYISSKPMLIQQRLAYSKTELINVPPTQMLNERQALKENGWRDTDPTHKGGTEMGAGHPQVYIQLNTRTPGQPVPCKWCGLRYALDTHH